MSSKTILHFTGMKSTSFGGLEQYLLDLIKFCNKRGFRSVLQYEEAPRAQDYLRELEACGASIIIAPIDGKLFRSWRNVRSCFKSCRPEIVQAHCVNPTALFFIARLARRFSAKRAISMVHAKDQVSRPLAYNMFDHVLSVSDAVGDVLVRGGVERSRLSTHYLGVGNSNMNSRNQRQLIRVDLGIADKTLLIATELLTSSQDYLEKLIQAIGLLKAEGINVHLLIFSREQSVYVLPDAVTGLGIADNIHWTGIRYDAEQIFSSSDAFCYLSDQL